MEQKLVLLDQFERQRPRCATHGVTNLIGGESLLVTRYSLVDDTLLDK